jgi:hypothetical protein
MPVFYATACDWKGLNAAHRYAIHGLRRARCESQLPVRSSGLMSRVEVLITSRCAQSWHLRLDKISVLQFEPRMIFGKVCAGSALKTVSQLTGRPLRYCHVLKETS